MTRDTLPWSAPESFATYTAGQSGVTVRYGEPTMTHNTGSPPATFFPHDSDPIAEKYGLPLPENVGALVKAERGVSRDMYAAVASIQKSASSVHRDEGFFAYEFRADAERLIAAHAWWSRLVEALETPAWSAARLEWEGREARHERDVREGK